MLIWRQRLGNVDCPYNERWILNLYFFSIRLHHWLGSDDLRYPHDHPWWYLSIVLCGSYTDITPTGNVERKAASIAFFPATHKHSVKLTSKTCWTLLITGTEKRVWGFWVNGKFRKRNRYFYDYGNHPCDNSTSSNRA